MTLAARFLALGALLFAAAAVSAQENERERFQASGTIRAVAPGAIQVATTNNELVAMKLGNKAEVSFTGKADASFLRPGMPVRFSAVVNKRGQVVEPITAITVFTPKERTDLGVYPEYAGDGPGSLGLFTDPEEEASKKPVKKVVEEMPYRVGGTLASIKNGKMVVNAGGVSIKCELADDARVSVAVSNLAYVQLGDQVEVDGWSFAAGRNAGIMANRVTVTAANPLSGERKPRTEKE
jgi:hypothetical protein